MYGCLLSPYDARDYQAKDYIAKGISPKEYMPAELAPILDQGNVGSCVAHAIATLKFYQEWRERKTAVQWSTDFIYHNRLESDWQGEGMVIREALSQLHKCGVCEFVDLPTNTDYPNIGTKNCIIALAEEAKPQKIKSYVRCNNMDEICEAIYQHGGAILAINSKASFSGHYFKTVENWVVPLPKANERTFAQHCICAIGYTKDGVIIQNSWGDIWGKGGLAVLPWDYPILEAWSVIDEMEKWDIIEMPINSQYAKVNGQTVALDVPPQIVNGRTLIPIRFVAENLGCEVEYLADKKTVIVRRRRNV